MIQIKPESDIYNNSGYVLYVNGHRTHLGVLSLKRLREYWRDFRNDLISGPDAISKLIFG